MGEKEAGPGNGEDTWEGGLRRWQIEQLEEGRQIGR